MRVPVAEQQVRASPQGLGYLRPAQVDTSGLLQGMNQLAQGVELMAQKNQETVDQAKKFGAMTDFEAWQEKVNDSLQSDIDNVKPGDFTLRQRSEKSYDDMSKEFVASQPPELQDEYRYKTAAYKNAYLSTVEKANAAQLYQFGLDGVNKLKTAGKLKIDKDYKEGDAVLNQVLAGIDAMPGATESQKFALKAEAEKDLRSYEYGKEARDGTRERPGDGTVKAGSPGDIINQKAREWGIDPVALATIISYETGGTFSTSIRGGKNNRYIGLIQFGDAEQQQFGAHQGQSFADQMEAVGRYLHARGLRPGDDIRQIYSIINAGARDRFGASDRPGYTVASHVDEMLRSHGKKAADLVGGKLNLDGMDDDPRYASVPVEDRIQIRQQVAVEQKQIAATSAAAMEAVHTEEKNQLYFGLAGGTRGPVDIQDAQDSGNYTYDEIAKAHEIFDTKNKSTTDAAIGAGRIAAGDFFNKSNPDDMNQLNAVYDETGGHNKIANMDDDYLKNTILSTAGKTGSISPRAIGDIQQMTSNSDAKKAMWAYDAIRAIEQASPDAYTAFSDHTKNLADFVATNRESYSSDEILGMIRGQKTVEQRRSDEDRREEAKKLLTEKDGPYELNIQGTVKADWGGYMPGSTPELPGMSWAKDALSRDYQNYFINSYVLYQGDAAKAKAAALKQLKRYWTVSNIGGVETVAKYSPETAGYRPVLGDFSYIEDQVRNTLGLAPGTKFQLLGDSQTEREMLVHQRGEAMVESVRGVMKKLPLPGIVEGTINVGAQAVANRNPMPSYQVVVFDEADGNWKAARKKDGTEVQRMSFFVPPELKALEALDKDAKIAESEQENYRNNFILKSDENQFMKNTPPEQEFVDEDIRRANIARDKRQRFDEGYQAYKEKNRGATRTPPTVSSRTESEQQRGRR